MMEIFFKIFWQKETRSEQQVQWWRDSKRPRESSLDESIANATNTDVFTESLKSEDCVAVLCNCMKKLEEEMKKVLQMYEKTKDSEIKGES